MSRLIDELEDLWEIAIDLTEFFHECCYNCQPRDDGEYYWLSEKFDLGDVLAEAIQVACHVNNKSLPEDLQTEQAIDEALSESPFVCPNCGTEHSSSDAEIGGEWLVQQGTDTSKANFLLTKAYWPFLTHYTKSQEGLSAFQVLSKIVNEKKLTGTRKFIHGNDAVVCFTECSPVEVYEMIKTLSRLSKPFPGDPSIDPKFKWARSKYGICVDREALINSGGRPVIHGDEVIKSALPANEVWRFVPFYFNKKPIDWTFEREFRIPGDLDFTRFKRGDIFILVENRRERFHWLASRDVPPYAIVPFDYVFSSDNPYPRLTFPDKPLCRTGG